MHLRPPLSDSIDATLVEIAETKVSYILAWSAKIYMQLDLDLQINWITFIWLNFKEITTLFK